MSRDKRTALYLPRDPTLALLTVATVRAVVAAEQSGRPLDAVAHAESLICFLRKQASGADVDPALARATRDLGSVPPPPKETR